MKILLTGGTGFVSRALVVELLRRGHKLTVLSRHELPRTTTPPPGASYRAGALSDSAFLESAISDCNAVIHLVGIIAEFRDQTFERVHVETTRQVVNAMKTCGIRRLVHMSALGTRLNAKTKYHRSKWLAEEIVRSSNLEATILRPSLIYGAEDRVTSLFLRIAKFSPLVPVMGSGRTKIQPLSVRDVAAAFANCLDRMESQNQTIDLVGPDPVTWGEFLDSLFQAANKRRGRAHIPFPMARPTAAFLEWFHSRFLNQVAPLTREQLQMLAEDNVGDVGRMRGILGIEPRRLLDGLREVLRERSATDVRTDVH